MEHITSRKNRTLLRLKSLGTDAELRRQEGEFVCDGLTTLADALDSEAEVTAVLWGEDASINLPEGVAQYSCPMDVMQSVSPLKNSRGPVFSVKIPPMDLLSDVRSAIALENVQDPGNVGTVIRTADAFGIDAVILVGSCADRFSPKTVRATMGGIFRQRVLTMSAGELKELTVKNGLKLYGAALSDSSADVRELNLKNAAVCIGSEGQGLSKEMLNLCDGQAIIPMSGRCESLNASVAAAVIMWEMTR